MSAAPPHRDPIGGVWACGIAAVLLLVATGAVDPCSPGLGQLPFLRPAELAVCVEAPGLAWFLLLDLLLIAAYTAFLVTATGWGARNLAGLGPFLGRFGRTLAVAPAVADLVENALLWFAGPYLLVRVASTAKWLFLVVALGLALWALLVGTARFLLPWSQPPQFPPDVPEGEVGEPRPCVEGSWFRSPDGDFPGVAYGIGLSGGGIRSAAFSSGVLQALAGTAWSPSKAQYLATVSGGGYVGVSSQGLRHPLTDPLDPDPYATDAPETARIRRHARYMSHSWPGLGRLLLAAAAGWVINAALVSCHSTAATTRPPTAQPSTARSTVGAPRSAGVSPGTSASTAPTHANGPTTSAALITQPAAAASRSLPRPGQLCDRYR
ncbi:MAG TPA: hypothetical protein VHS35_00740, partial [Pseudonocardia sp.]|nr:hypothetical protein [Pseudonocardia sp.]